MVLERIQRGRGQDAGLTHPTPELLLEATGSGRSAPELPASADPTGAPRPLLKQTFTVSNDSAHVDARCRPGGRRRRARAARRPSEARGRGAGPPRTRRPGARPCGQTVPPPALCVFSTQRSRGGEAERCWDGTHEPGATDSFDIGRAEDTAYAGKRVDADAAQRGRTATLVGYDVRTAFHQGTRSPGSVWTRMPIWFDMVPVGTKTASSLPRSSGRARLQLR